jgi:hypothetical protein
MRLSTSGTHPPATPDAPGRTRDEGGTHPDALTGRGVRPDPKPYGEAPGRTPSDKAPDGTGQLRPDPEWLP